MSTIMKSSISTATRKITLRQARNGVTRDGQPIDREVRIERLERELELAKSWQRNWEFLIEEERRPGNRVPGAMFVYATQAYYAEQKIKDLQRDLGRVRSAGQQHMDNVRESRQERNERWEQERQIDELERAEEFSRTV